MDKMREEFETWWRATMNIIEMDLHRFADGYSCHDTNRGWMVWQASREALSENHSPNAGKTVVPEGWQLVPVEPTIEMVRAATHSSVGFGTRAAYQAMLAATPKLRD